MPHRRNPKSIARTTLLPPLVAPAPCAQTCTPPASPCWPAASDARTEMERCDRRRAVAGLRARFHPDPVRRGAARAAAAPDPRQRRWPAWPFRSRTCSTSPASRRRPARVVLAHAPRGQGGRAGGGAPARRRRRADRPHQHDRVRLLRASASIRTTARRPMPSDAGDAAHPRRLVLGRRGLGGQRRGLHRPGLGHRRLDPHPGRAERHRRLQEHRAAGADGRRRCRCRPRWTPSAP